MLNTELKKVEWKGRFIFQNAPAPGPETSSGNKESNDKEDKGAAEQAEIARSNPSDMAAAAVATAGKVAAQFTGMTTQLKTALFQKKFDPSILLQAKPANDNKNDHHENSKNAA
jgi:hypothetical protein